MPRPAPPSAGALILAGSCARYRPRWRRMRRFEGHRTNHHPRPRSRRRGAQLIDRQQCKSEGQRSEQSVRGALPETQGEKRRHGIAGSKSTPEEDGECRHASVQLPHEAVDQHRQRNQCYRVSQDGEIGFGKYDQIGKHQDIVQCKAGKAQCAIEQQPGRVAQLSARHQHRTEQGGQCAQRIHQRLRCLHPPPQFPQFFRSLNASEKFCSFSSGADSTIFTTTIGIVRYASVTPSASAAISAVAGANC
jgi:hypothetical protein